MHSFKPWVGSDVSESVQLFRQRDLLKHFAMICPEGFADLQKLQNIQSSFAALVF